MKALLDTHAFLWAQTADPRLSHKALDFIREETNDLLFSAVCAWEIAIKFARGRLPLPEEPEHYVTGRMVLLRAQPLPIEISHALRVAQLPPIHRDPFDRLLIAQAQVEEVPILTNDPNISRYDVEVIW